MLIEEQCSCLPALWPTPNPNNAVVFELSEGEEPDWSAIDVALVEDHVVVRFDPLGHWDRLTILRTDTGDNRLVLDGGEGNTRATVAGMLTPFDGGARHRITVRGFNITGSRDKGIYWEAGDDVLIEDVVIHGNRGTPALNLQYSNRAGVASANFTVRNSHIYDQNGECLYIGGSEGEDEDSHVGLLLENNLIHDCRSAWTAKTDGINVKDRLSEVVVRRNVVMRTDWGIEVASPGLYAQNLVIDSRREGFQISDAFQATGAMAFVDNTVIRPGHDGFHISTDRAVAEDMRMVRNTVIDAEEAGLLLATNLGIELDVEDLLVVGSAVAFDGWGEADMTLWSCRTAGNEVDFARLLEDAGACESADQPDRAPPAGEDGLFFTEDDPWLVVGGASLSSAR